MTGHAVVIAGGGPTGLMLAGELALARVDVVIVERRASQHLVDGRYDGTWELPAIGVVTGPTAVLTRPDGYVAWAGDLTRPGLADALTTWFGPPASA